MNDQQPSTNEHFKSAILRLEDLECYARAREFRKHISGVCEHFPKAEQFRLKDQLLRSSRSIAANIAEGYGRHHHQENLQFCRQARGSLTETIEHLNCALDESFLDQTQYDSLREESDTLLKLLNGYISYLRKAASAAKTR